VRRLLLLTTVGLSLMLSCSRHDPLKSRRIVLIVQSLADAFDAHLVEGAQLAAAERNLDLTIIGIEEKTHVERQAALIENAVIRRVGALIIYPTDSKALIAPLKKATKKGIAVIAVANPLDPEMMKKQDLTIPFVGPDNKQAGTNMAELLAQKIEGKGKVAVLQGVAGMRGAELREQGFREACKQCPGVQIVAQVTTNWRRKGAADALAKILAEHPDLKGVYAVNAAMALGATDAVKAKGKTGAIAIAAYGTSKAARDAILAGTLTATVDPHADTIGARVIELAEKMMEGKTVPESTTTPIDAVEAQALK